MIKVLLLIFIFSLLSPLTALAGRLELSAGGSFSRSNYGEGNYGWTRRWGASLGYRFTERSEIEIAMQDVVDRTFISGYEDTTFHDQIFSLNWVQSIFGKDAIIDPFFKIGVGQLNRDAAGTYASGGSPTSQVDSITGILGGGLRINITHHFGIRAEVDSYLTGGRISTYQDNISANVGVSVYF